ncbi:YceI family protein [Agrobacterium radiobacter]|uniref:YceI family protein n=1 Tax=Agrobacterium radiobacter TaxID=362 RepID=UPI003466C9A7
MSNTTTQTLAVDKNPKNIVGGRYVIDSVHSRVLFNVLHFGVSNYWGEFYGPVGWLEINPMEPEKTKMSVSVLAAQVKTNSPKLDEELRSAEWFDAENYPNITLSVDEIQPVTETSATLKGIFTLHGVSKLVNFDVEFVAGAKNSFTGLPTIGFEASARISRREFGVSAKYPVVGDTVNIIVSAAFDFA